MQEMKTGARTDGRNWDYKDFCHYLEALARDPDFVLCGAQLPDKISFDASLSRELDAIPRAVARSGGRCNWSALVMKEGVARPLIAGNVFPSPVRLQSEDWKKVLDIYGETPDISLLGFNFWDQRREFMNVYDMICSGQRSALISVTDKSCLLTMRTHESMERLYRGYASLYRYSGRQDLTLPEGVMSDVGRLVFFEGDSKELVRKDFSQIKFKGMPAL